MVKALFAGILQSFVAFFEGWGKKIAAKRELNRDKNLQHHDQLK